MSFHYEPYAKSALLGFGRAGKFILGTLRPQGITPFIISYPYGQQLRFGVRGAPGLFGVTSINQLLEAMGIGPVPEPLEGYIAGLLRTDVDVSDIKTVKELQEALAGQLRMVMD